MTGDVLDAIRAHFAGAPRHSVEVPEWGLTIWWGPLTLKEAATILNRWRDVEGGTPAAHVMHRARREDGSPLFDPDAQTLKVLRDEADAAVVLRVYNAMVATDLPEAGEKKH